MRRPLFFILSGVRGGRRGPIEISFLLIALVSATSFAEDAKPAPSLRLAEIYCQAMGQPSLPSWDDVEAHLKNRQPFPSVPSDDTLRQCLAVHGPEFDEAEFIVKGEEVLQTIIGAADDTGAAEAQGRHGRYEELWKGFVARLKSRGMAPAAAPIPTPTPAF